MAADYLLELPSNEESRWILGGYSFGGLVAYEMSQQLRAKGHEIESLILFDTPNPAYEVVARSLGERISYHWSKHASASFGGRFGRLLRRMNHGLLTFGRTRLERLTVKAFDLLPWNLPSAWQHLAVREWNDGLVDSYSIEAEDVPILLMRAQEQGDKFRYPLDLGWSEILKGNSPKVVEIQGSHLEIFEPEHLEQRTRVCRDALPLVYEKSSPVSQRKCLCRFAYASLEATWWID